jgi:hypothetical protein
VRGGDERFLGLDAELRLIPIHRDNVADTLS